MSDLFSSLQIFTIIKTILSTFFYCFQLLQESCKMGIDRDRVQRSTNDNSGQKMVAVNRKKMTREINHVKIAGAATEFLTRKIKIQHMEQ